MASVQSRLAGSTGAKGRNYRMGRKRETEPDKSTPEGQCALWLRKLTDGKDLKLLAGAVGVSEKSLYNYLNGLTSPDDSTRDGLAKALGLRDYRDLMPPDRFLRSIGIEPAPKAGR